MKRDQRILRTAIVHCNILNISNFDYLFEEQLINSEIIINWYKCTLCIIILLLLFARASEISISMIRTIHLKATSNTNIFVTSLYLSCIIIETRISGFFWSYIDFCISFHNRFLQWFYRKSRYCWLSGIGIDRRISMIRWHSATKNVAEGYKQWCLVNREFREYARMRSEWVSRFFACKSFSILWDKN